jgi:hypothetical protein
MCGGCNLYEPWSAVVIGLIAGHAYIAVHIIMLRLQVLMDIYYNHRSGGNLDKTCDIFSIFTDLCSIKYSCFSYPGRL